jgi:hypothetical protein
MQMSTRAGVLAGFVLIGSLSLAGATAQAQTFAALTTSTVAGERDCVSPNQAHCEKKALKTYNKDLDNAQDAFEKRMDKAYRRYGRDLWKSIPEREAKAAFRERRQKARAKYKHDEQQALKQYEKALE